jgi:pullulanase/glycogen debranching enzyme
LKRFPVCGSYLCLFGEAEGDQETARFEVAEQTDRVWRIYLGQRYGYRVHGPVFSSILWSLRNGQ